MSEDEDEDYEDDENSPEATMAGVQGQDSFEATNSLMSSHYQKSQESSTSAKQKTQTQSGSGAPPELTV